ncbi:histidine kinase, dimerization and phosphoacceptor region [Bifidobacterium reuteri DSM 23975]|nr:MULTISPECIES: histidine kinase [Bifidobacterium]KFI56218.1 histidine kinase, dimerization and phosphoacceptor region [Bifidobacterium callitrichos DSM 23973]KFI86619.1 histidine kinase, dimerization and phosphoacceptor region [Bifidobacterium reuteri DSM 23975]PLS29726.1 histidine kinase, dimerization and phosphoacceptor region [Bifidobacterium parmae]PLS31121.1 histidine kinase, dimerization and phosphoacceptor region [Bifidobacterium margollesii]
MERQTVNVGRVTATAMPLCVLAVEVMMLMWERIIGTPLDPMYTLAKQTGGFVLLLLALCLSCSVLMFRYRVPSVTLMSQLVLTLMLSFWHADSILLVQLVAAFYAFMRTTGERRMYIGSLATTLAVTLATFMSWPASQFLGEWPGRILLLALAGAIALAHRGMVQARRATAAAGLEHRRAQTAVKQRDAAVRRSRIAGQLHDSVGHGLTTIIALSEGLSGKTGDPRVDEALKGINEIARESLADTRKAVRALTETDTTDEDPAEPGSRSMRSWDDIRPILAHARTLGIITIFTETGIRADDEPQADLCFDVTREAITNAIRHGRHVTHLNVSWNHQPNGVTVIVRNDGATGAAQAVAPDDGTGLAGLSRRVQDAGGTFAYGPVDGTEWQVKAVIPPTGNMTGKQPAERKIQP